MKLTTRQELEKHIANHKGRDIPLFSAIGKMHGGIVQDETIKSHRKPTIEINPTTETPFLFIDGIAFYSLTDRHLNGPQNYNDNWWFTTRAEAEEHVK